MIMYKNFLNHEPPRADSGFCQRGKIYNNKQKKPILLAPSVLKLRLKIIHFNYQYKN